MDAGLPACARSPVRPLTATRKGTKNAFSLKRVGSGIAQASFLGWLWNPGLASGKHERWGRTVRRGGALLRECQPLPHILGLCQRCGLIGFCVFPTIMVWSPLLLRSNLHNGLLGLILPVERVLWITFQGSRVVPRDSSYGSG